MTDTKDTNPKDLEGTRKVPISCVPAPVMAEVGLALLEGARKYGRHNYRVAGVRASVYYDAAFRHLGAWWEGEDIDPDSGLSHVTKAIAGLCVLRDSMMRGNWDDDRPPRVAAGWVGEMNAKAEAIIAAYPNPKAPFTEREAAGAPLARGARLPEPERVAEPAPEPEPYAWVRGCKTCSHEACSVSEEPCLSCDALCSGWAPKPEPVAEPAPEPAHAPDEPDELEDCATCEHEKGPPHREPCRSCDAGWSGWVPKTVCQTCRHDGDEDACATCITTDGKHRHWSKP